MIKYVDQMKTQQLNIVKKRKGRKKVMEQGPVPEAETLRSMAVLD